MKWIKSDKILALIVLMVILVILIIVYISLGLAVKFDWNSTLGPYVGVLLGVSLGWIGNSSERRKRSYEINMIYSLHAIFTISTLNLR